MTKLHLYCFIFIFDLEELKNIFLLKLNGFKRFYSNGDSEV